MGKVRNVRAAHNIYFHTLALRNEWKLGVQKRVEREGIGLRLKAALDSTSTTYSWTPRTNY